MSFDTAYRTLSDLLDAAGPLDRHRLLVFAERASRAEPHPWVAALRRLRAERTIEPAVVTYLLHLLTNEYAFARALVDPELANLVEGLRMVVLLDYDDDFEVLAEVSEGEEWVERDVEANAIRAAMSARRQHVEREIVRGLGEEEYAEALGDLPLVLDACGTARDILMGVTWPLGFGDALRATGDLRVRTWEPLVGFSFDVAAAAPRDILLTVLDRSCPGNRGALAEQIQLLAEMDPNPWLEALGVLRVEGRVSAEERFYLADTIAVFHVLELQSADAEAVRMRRQHDSLTRLYGVPKLDAQFCDEAELEPLPKELAMMRAHLWACHHRYVGAALRELGEPEVAASFVGRNENDHYERLGLVEEALFRDGRDPPRP